MTNKLFWLVCAVALPLAAAPAAKISPDLKTRATGQVDVIVQYATVPSERQHQKIAAHGGKLKTRFGQFKAAAYTLQSDTVEDIAALPEVKYVSRDRQLRGQLDYSATAVNADLAWASGWTGNGVGIAIVDSGIAASADLDQMGNGLSRVVYAESFGDLNGTHDAYGHGTHVAGIVAGDGAGSTGKYRGIAPDARLINLRVLDHTGAGSDSAVIAAIMRAIELKDKYGIRVLNLSLGRPVFESHTLDPLCQAVEAAWQAGIVVVVAAGNDGRDNASVTQGYGTILAPGNDPYVITVGAMKSMNTYGRADDLIASYSSKGPTAIDHIVKPDLVAPGNQVVSVMGTGNTYLARTYPQNVVNGTYFQLSGTSMAVPVVSAAAAMLIEQNPSITPDQIKARLMKTAGKDFPRTSVAIDPMSGASYTSYYDPFTIGAGYLDINAALNNPDLAHGPALSPVADYDAETGEVTLLRDNLSLWGSSPAWSNAQIWGSSVVWGASIVWGNSVVWGAGNLDGMSVVWGSSAIGVGGSGLAGEMTSVAGEI
jgi:serine protease AprX